MTYLAGVLILALGVIASIALHEVGHLVPAKRFGVKVTQYMIGFGPTLWSRRRGETEYGFKGFPLGGYIRMIGMFPPAPGSDPRRLRASSTGPFQSLAEDARRLSAEEVGPADADRVFYKLSVPKKVVVMMGGPSMNLLIAVVLLGVLQSGFGVPELTTQVTSVSRCVVPATAVDQDTCGADDPKAPAAEAGVLPGDTIVSVDGRPATSWDAVRDAIREAGGREVPLVVRRDSTELALSVTPLLTQRPALDDDGQVLTDDAGQLLTEEVGFLGVSPGVATVRQPLTELPGVVRDSLGATAGVVLRLPQRMVDVGQAAFGTAERDPNGPIGLVGVGRIAGELSSFEREGELIPLADRAAALVGIVASVNLALFVFNLIPLLPLDGGHVAGALWEGLRRQLARVRSRPDPGPVDVAKALPVAYGMALLIVGMSLLLLYADIVRPVTLTG